MRCGAAARRRAATISNVLTGANAAALRAWATAHKSEAMRCLTPPPARGGSLDLESLDGYLLSRRWEVGPAEGRALASQALTYPLTLARYAGALQLENRSEARVTVVGARGEASLPSSSWAELLDAVPGVARWRLHFVGPEVTPDRRARGPVAARRGARSLGISATRALVRRAADLRLPPLGDDDDDDGTEASSAAPHAVVLFNPGCGHGALEAGWRPALDAVFSAAAPALFTAHSAFDMDRDLGALTKARGALPFAVAPELNPFRSRKVLTDPQDPGHLTCANYAAFVVAEDSD